MIADENEVYGAGYLDRLRRAGRISRQLKALTLYKMYDGYLGGKILDFGCGDLSYAKYVERQNDNMSNYHACDINPATEKEAGELGIVFFSDITHIKNHKYSLIIADNVLEHIVDWRSTMLQLIEKLSDEGQIIIGVPGRKGYFYDKTHMSFITEFDIKLFCDKHGLELEEIYSYPLNSKRLASVMQIFSRHVLFYFRIKKF